MAENGSGSRRQKLVPILSLAVTAFVLTLTFQNCSGGFEGAEQSGASLGGPGPGPGPGPTPSPATARIAWDKSDSPGVTGYRVYVGTQSGVYGPAIDAGTGGNPDAPTFELTNLMTSQTYFVVVKAYDGGGQESPPSNEITVVK